MRPADLPVAGDKYEQIIILASAHHQRLHDLPRVHTAQLRGLDEGADWAVTHER